MRNLPWIMIALVGVAAVLAGGFFLYLNWAFTPRGAPSGARPSDTRKRLLSGPAGDGLFFAVSELRSAASADVFFDVTIAKDLASAKANSGDTVLRTVNFPIPTAVKRPEPALLEIHLDRAAQFPDGRKFETVRIALKPDGSLTRLGCVVIENGVEKTE